jgi:thioredoxin reductase (NADPH)
MLLAPQKNFQARAKKVKLYGHADSPEAYAIRDFLSRSVVHFDWVELPRGSDYGKILGLEKVDESQLPIIELPDGERLFAPTLREIAARLGWITQPKLQEYDLSIYGAGPAGLSAAVYAASEGLSTIVVERHAVGGQAGTSSLIENYLGFPHGVSGATLAERARQQAVKFGAEILLLQEGVKAEFKNNRIYVELAGGDHLVARANICATGVEYRRLNLPNEDRLLNRGVYYGAGASEAIFCAGDAIFVVGGGNSAGQAVLNFSRYAAHVTMLVRSGNLAASLSQYLIDRILSTANIEVIYHASVTALEGDDHLRQITIRDNRDGSERTVPASRIFICIGGEPNTEWARPTAIVREKSGYLVTGPDLLSNGQLPLSWPRKREPFYLETSIPGCFAAGDVRHGSVKRVASAVGEGAMAVTFAHKYLQETE